jgi:hypothetical protein
LHAAYAPGDWVVSFSGCGVLMGAPACEAMYGYYAELAEGGSLRQGSGSGGGQPGLPPAVPPPVPLAAPVAAPGHQTG